jgi:hypothetical protein
MKIKTHSESHLVELEDGSRWQIFPGDLDITIGWQPETALDLVRTNDDIGTHALVSTDGKRVRVLPEGMRWPERQTKAMLREG